MVRIPDSRRTELVSKLARLCLDFCASQYRLAEPDASLRGLVEESLARAKELCEAIAEKAKKEKRQGMGAATNKKQGKK
jgi:hypothetical protein